MAIENAKRDENYVPTLIGVDMSTGLLPTKVYVDETTHRLLVSSVITGTVNAGGLVPEEYDYVGVTYPTTSSEAYAYKTGGAGGTLIATVTVTYTNDTKVDLSSIART